MASQIMTTVSKIKNALKKSNVVMNCYAEIDTQFRAFLYTLSPTLLAKYIFFKKRRRLPDFNKPQTFDEKLLWLMLFWKHPLKTQCADKYAVRSYVEEHGLGHTLPELFGVYEKSSEIDLDSLPERFVLKCTRGCGFNIICKNKGDLNWKGTKRQLNSWMKVDISKVIGEDHYARIHPRIVCESYLDDLSGDVPNDYKVYCFNGKAHCTMACTERGTGERAVFNFYDLNWEKKLLYNKTSQMTKGRIPKPDAYEEIIVAAEKLSKPFPFVRMDFYSVKGKAIFGEMTFTPNGCIDKGYTDLAQHELGKLIKLPEKRLEWDTRQE